ncbi:probable galacturonosyltransferase 9, partial [Tanacetum coccineum]
ISKQLKVYEDLAKNISDLTLKPIDRTALYETDRPLDEELMGERIEHPEKYRDDELKLEFEDPKLYHYPIFSDNVIAVSVVVNSTVTNAEEPWKHVFHIVIDKMNLAAI